ncbi:hypothetical protein B0H13DRAFT_1860508 [Mycena leptocephala]|nr:hypothetical protein B0H13DRAFT_1860508 [Mycena leptocephala]
MDRAANGWRQTPSLDRSVRSQKVPSVYSAASHGTYVQPALAVPPPQYDSGFAPREDNASMEHCNAGLAGIGRASRMVGENITQPQRAALVYPTQTSGDSMFPSIARSVPKSTRRPGDAEHALVVPESKRHRPNSLSTSPTTPISPTPLPNLYDAEEWGKRPTTNMPLSPIPLSPTPLPNPYD